MKKLVMFVVACLLFGGVAIAQQDPDDPGFQDSLIVADVTVDSGATFAFVPIYAVTDDSVAFYNLPLRWIAPAGGVHVGSGTQYFPPLTNWDIRYDTVMLSQDYVRQIGWSDIDSLPNPLLNTNHARLNAWTLRFVIAPGTPSQLVTLDTTWDDRNGPVIFGLANGTSEITPAFWHGHIAIRPFGVDPAAAIPTEFALKQNYPNPFNPETNIGFSLPKDQDVFLVVYNLLGQQVRTLVNSSQAAGEHAAIWDGRNDDGADVPSGIYFYRLTTPEFSQTNKMVLVR